jgi:predicted amidohydrolase
MDRYIAAAIQLDTQQDKRENLAAISAFIDEAAAKGAKLVALPETMTYIGTKEGIIESAEPIGGETTKLLCEKALRHSMWVHGGSIYEKVDGTDKVYNTTIFVNPKGEVAAVYRKIHLFDVDLASGPSSKESDSYLPGDEVTVVNTELGRIGLAICYDMRFPELFRIMTLQGTQVFIVPAAFTLYTGRDHWEPIFRARAIENLAYFIVPNQIGKKTTFQTGGKSIIADPWGNIVAKASDYPCVITAEINLPYVASIREQLPALKNVKSEIYKKYNRW